MYDLEFILQIAVAMDECTSKYEYLIVKKES